MKAALHQLIMTHLLRQLDLFDAAGPDPARRPTLAVSTLDDSDLIATIPSASQRDCDGLIGEAGRRRLSAAIPALEFL
jgi:hypothetical protein